MFLFHFVSNQLQETIYKWGSFSRDPVIMQYIPRLDCLLQETGEVMTCSVTNEFFVYKQDSFGPKIMFQVNLSVFDILESSD